MLRVVLGVASLLVLGGLVMQHTVPLPRGTELPLPAHVDQGIPLTTIDLRSADQPLTPDEIAQGIRWWQLQPQALLDQLTGLLRNETSADGWTNLYASATADGGHVLVVVGNQGRLGTIRFAGDGMLLACDTTPNEVLPIILPTAEGGFRRPTAEAVRSIETRLRYLREGSPVAWHALVIPDVIVDVLEVEDEVAIETTSPVQTTRAYGCCTGCFPRSKAPSVTSQLEAQPTLPVANN